MPECFSLSRAILLKASKLLLGFGFLFLCGCSFLFGPPDTYEVEEGDTLFEIAERYDLSLSELARINGVSDPRSLQIGQILKLPESGPDGGDKQLGMFSSKRFERPLRLVDLGEARGYVHNLSWPVSTGGVVSPFGYRWGTFHEGIDIKGDEGDPIYAAHDGQVVYSGRGIHGYGNIIVIKGRGLVTIYAHNRRNRVDVGDRVDRGDRIGEVGQTGKATGPHLHFETRVKDAYGKNTAVDPLVFYR